MAHSINLSNLRKNTKEILTELLKKFSNDGRPEEIFRSCLGISASHHDLGILNYFLDGDTHSFFAHMYQSMACRIYYLKRVYAGLKPEPSYMGSTIDGPLFDGIASAYISEARELSKLMFPERLSSLDKIDRFAFSSLIRLLLEERPSDILKASNEEAMKQVGKDDIKIQCLLALGQNHEMEFIKRFNELVEARVNVVQKNEVQDEVDQLIYVEGLAILRIAKLHGVNYQQELPMLPLDLQADISVPPPVDGFPVIA